MGAAKCRTHNSKLIAYLEENVLGLTHGRRAGRAGVRHQPLCQVVAVSAVSRVTTSLHDAVTMSLLALVEIRLRS